MLIAGGTDAFYSTSWTELYDSSVVKMFPYGQSYFCTDMNDARRDHTATLLPNGDVLVTGGYQGADGGPVDTYLASAELRDHGTEVWAYVGPMSTPRQGHTATLLSSGAVLVAGGGTTARTNTAEVFQGATPTGTISVTTNLASGSFTITGPVTYNGSGVSFTQTNVPPGTYTTTFNPIPGCVTTPSSQTQTVGGGTVIFSGTYQNCSGTIIITSNMQTATFTLVPYLSGAPSGGPFPVTISSVPIGTYQVGFNDIPGYVTPSLSPLVVTPGTTTTFVGTYTSIPIGPSPPPKVLIVPGLFGTKLATSDSVVWLSNHVLNNTIILNKDDYDQLQYTLAGQPTVPLTTTAIASDGIDYGGLLNLSSKTGDSGYALDCDTFIGLFDPTCITNIYVYNKLVVALTAANYDVSTFAYDWRRDIKDLSDELAARIEVLGSTPPTRQVAIIAHSMGGLVIAEALARHGNDITSLIHSVTTLGTPFAGAVETYLNFRGWDTPLYPIITSQQIQAMGSNWTSAYELLPQGPFVTLIDGPVPLQGTYDGTYSPQLLPALPRAVGSNSALNAATGVWSDIAGLQQPLPPFYVIVGSGLLTYNALVEPKTTPGCLVGVQGNGDQIVPLQSATAPSWLQNIFYVGESHGGLPSNDQVISAIQTILQGLSPTNLWFDPLEVTGDSTATVVLPCVTQ